MPETPSNPKLPPPGDVPVWLFAIQSDAPLSAFEPMLDRTELARAGSFSNAQAQSRFASCRSTVKGILCSLTAQPPGLMHFREAPHGKPFIDSVYFNYANTKTHGALAVCTSADIGIDLEDMSRRCNIRALARLFCPQEREQLERLDGEELRRAFFTLWVRKEAVMKADGRGLLIGLGNILADARAECESVCISSSGSPESLWRVPMRFFGNLALAVAVPKARPDLRVLFPEKASGPGDFHHG